MRVLVIGGTGFVGPHVVRGLTERGHHVVVAHRGRTEGDVPPQVQHIHHDADDLDHFLALLAPDVRRLAPEIVLHMIPLSDRDSQAVVDMSRGVARRIVGISSEDVYRAYGRVHRREPGPPDPVPLGEEAPLRAQFFPDAPNVEKILAERALLGAPDLPGTILRWPAVYGPHDPQHRLYGYLRHMDAGRPHILLAERTAQWRWTRGFSENVAQAVVLAVTDDRATGRVYNVGEPDPLGEAAWVRAIGRAAGWQGDVVVLPDALAERAPEPLPDWLHPQIDTNQHWVVDTTRIRQELGYAEAVSRDEALRRTVTWERTNPPLPSASVPAEDEMRERYATEDRLLAWLRSVRAKDGALTPGTV